MSKRSAIHLSSAISRGGFTLLEMLLTSVIVSIALLGVFSMIKQAGDVQARAETHWAANTPAHAVVDHLADQVARLVSQPGWDSVVTGTTREGSFSLQMVVAGDTLTRLSEHGVGVGEGGTSLVEYRLVQEQPEVTVKPEQPKATYRLELRQLRLADGNILDLDPPVIETSEGKTEVDWDQIEPVPLAYGLDALSIAFRSMQDKRSKWKERYSGSPAGLQARVRVTVMGREYERYTYGYVTETGQDSGGQGR